MAEAAEFFHLGLTNLLSASLRNLAMNRRVRHNGEGSIYPYRKGFAAYTWVTKPDGTRARKYVYGKDRETVHGKWVKLYTQAQQGPISTATLKVSQYLHYWLAEKIEPNRAPSTYAGYETYTRLYINPVLGNKRLDRLRAKDVQVWINSIPKLCQCCLQKKDAKRKRPTGEKNARGSAQRCCAIGKCCGDHPSPRTIRNIRDCLRAALTSAIEDDLISRNVAAKIKLPSGWGNENKKKRKAWTSNEARQFLESARADGDPMYAAYVLVLVLGLRKGEALGMSWEDVDLNDGELTIEFQLQRVRRKLRRRKVKTPTSEAPLPLPDICLTALRLRKGRQETDRAKADEIWRDGVLVFTTRHGTPIEPRNFNRSWDARVAKAGLRKITIHNARRTCGSLLADLGVHPRVAMQILRHADFKITMEIYTEVSDEQTRAALKRLGESLDQPPQ